MSLVFTPVHEIGPRIAAVRTVYRSGVTKKMTWRRAQLTQLVKLLEENKEQIKSALVKDLKMDALVRDAEVSGSLQECEQALAQLDSWTKPDSTSVPAIIQPGSGAIYKDPLGIICMISAWNYPCSLLVRPLVGAIAAGNAVVIKPSEVSVNTSGLMGSLVEKYLDNKAIIVINGGVAETTELLKQKFDKIIYTGNGEVGKIIMRAAAEHLTPVILELGGKSPLIVGPDVNMDNAVPRIVWGKFTNCGQTCIAPDYAYVHESRYDEFLKKMKQQIADFYGADPSKSSDYGKIINSRHAARIDGLIKSSGNVFCGGVVDEEAAYVAPTLVTDASVDSPLMTKEIFGPVLPVFRYKNVSDVIDFINDRPKPLALYVFAKDQEFINNVLTNTTSGGGCVNEVLMHNICKELPFGGVGDSGMGAYNGKISFDSFTHHKGMLKRPNSSDLSLRFPPYTDSKMSWLARIDKIVAVVGKNKKALTVVLASVLAFVVFKLYKYFY